MCVCDCEIIEKSEYFLSIFTPESDKDTKGNVLI